VLKSSSAVIYIASLSEYDQKCYEDDIKNRILESLEIFEEEINSTYFKNLPIILFLNKVDIFKKKIAKKDLTCVFQEYEGGNDVKTGIEFIKMKYLSKIENPERIRVYVTNAMDEESVLEAFKDAQDSILKYNLNPQ
jgi:guanine nucleotide-binding protein G(i) subunit alpha